MKELIVLPACADRRVISEDLDDLVSVEIVEADVTQTRGADAHLITEDTK
jgi:hypothetical protein